ncbi:MAG: hypothetical protein KatS3mg109_0099 [Pirellulaceae bacterium]|nr:MAG: hypothetical protein KatS3mg109_0099 [Pirellulaceae bacterium]
MYEQDALKRHVQVYLAMETKFIPRYDQYCPEPPEYSSYKAATAAAKQAEFRRKWLEEDARELLHCVRIDRIEAAVYDFRSLEYDALRAVPAKDDKFFRVSIRREDVKGSLATAFYCELFNKLAEKGLHGLTGDRVTFRSRNGDWDRHLLRVELIRGRRSAVAHIPNDLFFKVRSLDYGTVFGPDRYADHNILLTQLKVRSPHPDYLLGQLHETLLVFHAGFLCPLVKADELDMASKEVGVAENEGALKM